MQVRVKLAAGAAVVGALGVGGAAVATGGDGFRESLKGYEEVPAVSTGASGTFHAAINRAGNEIAWRLSYENLEGDVQQAHIHLGQKAVNGGISVWLCGNVPTTPAGTQACPPAPATVSGTIRPAEIAGPAAQGIEAGQFSELVAAMRSGVTYANVHSTRFPGGEIRAQLDGRGGRDREDDD